jgi:hypothetical protein
MRIVYGVKHIEVEFGQRSMGWKLYNDYSVCISDTKDCIKNQIDDCYFGPVQPPYAVEIPYNSLGQKYQQALTQNGQVRTAIEWEPMFQGKKHLL